MHTGRLEVIAGPMFSGKTETLIHRVQLARAFDLRAIALKPATDTRHGDSFVHTHSGRAIEAQTIDRDASALPAGWGLIAIDEAQFLSWDSIPRMLDIVRGGGHVLLAGLDLDSFGKPFGPMPALMAFADHVTKLSGTCARCKGASTRSHRLVPSDAAILVGGSETYEPRCITCFDPKGGK